jgi:hypothetical protein
LYYSEKERPMNKKLNQIVVLVIIALTVLSCKKERVSVNDRIMHEWILVNEKSINSMCPRLTNKPNFPGTDSVICIDGTPIGYKNGEPFDYNRYLSDISMPDYDLQSYDSGSLWKFNDKELGIQKNTGGLPSVCCNEEGKPEWGHSLCLAHIYLIGKISITNDNITVLYGKNKKFTLQIIEITEDDMILRDNDSNIELYFDRKKKQNH